MTSDQLRELMKVLDTGSVAALDRNDRASSRDWRREKVHTTPEVTIGSLVRNDRLVSGD